MKHRIFSPILIVPIMTFSLFGTPLRSETIALTPDADAMVDQTLANTNFGNDPKVIARDSMDTEPRPVLKGYLRFDASDLPEIAEVTSLAVYYDAKRARSAIYVLIEGPGANEWEEDAINWNNAPANDPKENVDGFVAGVGQRLTEIAAHTGEPHSIGYVELGTGEVGADEAKRALARVLNTGDRKATIGIFHNGTRFYSIASKESGNPPATLTVRVAE